MSITQKHMLETADYYIKAFSEPSIEHLWAYVRVFFIVVLVSYACWNYCLRKEKATIKVSFDDVGHKCEVGDDSPREGEAEKKSKRKEKGESTRTKDTTATSTK